jgi:hypothetical protein
MLHHFLPLALLVSGIALIAPATGQPPLPAKPPLPPKPPGLTGSPDPLAALQKLTGAKRAELDQAVRGVAVYPAQTRAAILDLAQYSQEHPGLLKELAKLRNDSPEAIDRYLTSNKLEPALQEAAARVLVEAPETVEKLQERPDLVAIVGLAWSTPPGKKLISTVLDLAAASQEKTRNNSADRWASRLKADPKLMQQFVQLLEEFTQKTTPAGQQPDNIWQSYGYGIYKSQDGYVVNDVPSADVVNYILAVGPQYPAASNAVIQQYLDGQNQADFNDAVGGWYNTNSSSIPQSASQSDSDYYALLQELGNLANALTQQSGSGNSGNSGSGSGDSGSSGSDSGNSGSSGSDSGNSGSSGSDSGNSGSSGSDSGNSGSSGAGAPGASLNSNRARYPKLSNWQAKNPAPKLGSPANLTRLQNGPRPDAGKTPFDRLGNKGPTKTPSASPFSDRMKVTPPGARARPTPHAGQNPFQIASRPKGAAPKPSGAPKQLVRGSPSLGHQLTRAPRQMSATWRPHGGGPRPGPRR